MYRTFITTILLFHARSTYSSRCNSFQDVQMTVHPDRGTPHKLTLTGCIERVAFNQTITKAFIKDQIVPRLGRDSVRNMKYLNSISVGNCGTKVIEPGAFRNVPALKYLKVVHGEIEVVPAGVFTVVPQLERLHLTHNKIAQIENEAFSGVPTLKKILVHHNMLTQWKKHWFVNTTNVEVLDFSYNKIRILPRGAFSEFSKLKEVYFDHNDLDVIESEAFKGVTNLTYLGLRYNQLKTIHHKVFPNEICIQLMNIGANYLNFISKKLMFSVRVKQLTFDANPWTCPYRDQVLFWIYGTNATATVNDKCLGDDIPDCVYPKSFSSTCTETIDDDVTRTYLDQLSTIEPHLERDCARLD